MSSSDRVLIQSEIEGVDKWVLHSLNENESNWILDRQGSVSAISPDGRHLVGVENSILRMFDVATKKCIGIHNISGDCIIYRVMWSDNVNIYFVSTHGILRFQLTNMDSLTRMTKIDPSINLEMVYNIQVDEECGFYVIQMFDGTTERMQYGRFYSDLWTVKSGCAACFLYPDNCFLSDHPRLIFLEKESNNPRIYTLCSERLTNNDALPERKYSYTFSADIEDHAPLYLVPENQGCYVTVCTNKGCFLLFDALNGLRIFTFLYDSKKVIGVACHPGGGFIFMRENDSTVIRTRIDPQVVVSSYANLQSSNIQAFDMACRLCLRDTDCPAIYSLVHGLYGGQKRETIARFLKLTKSLTLTDSTKMMSLLEQDSTLLSLNQFIWTVYTTKKQINWVKEIEDWCNQYCGVQIQEVTTSTKPTESLKRAVDVSCLANRFKNEGISLESDTGKAIMKDLFPDPFERAKARILISKKMEEMEMCEYKNLANQIKEKDVKVDDEYWVAILEEVYEDKLKRKIADKNIRQFM